MRKDFDTTCCYDITS